MDESLLHKKTFCVVTGATRGLGKSIAEKFASNFSAGSTVLLLARSIDKLQEVTNGIKQANPNINILFRRFDQSNLNESSKEMIENILSESNTKPNDFEQAMIVHNASVLGDITKYASQITDNYMVEEMMNVNVTGTVLLNARFLSIFVPDVVPSRVVINITSKSALLPFPSMSLYCAAKAARDMFFLTLAKEDTDIRVLTFGPGGMDTDMATSVMQNSANAKLRHTFTSKLSIYT